MHRDIFVRSGWTALGLGLSLSATALVGCHASGGVDPCSADATSVACPSGHPDGAPDAIGGLDATGAPDATGASCVPANPCHTGATSISRGASVCADTGQLLPNGAGCGSNRVCGGGTCVACTDGASCMPATSPCRAGILDCSNGTPTCVVQASAGPNGTSCGPNLVCNLGSCVSCLAGNLCGMKNGCSVSEIICDTGVPVCTQIYVLPDGTFCDINSVCRAGSCVSCGDAGVDGGGGCGAGGGRPSPDAGLIPL